MATQVQRRRGTTAQHAAFSGQLAELTVDTDKMTVVVQDGSTLGGHPLATEANLTAHISDTVGAHDASAISNVPAGTIAATDVQGAINELDGDITSHLGDTTAAHTASAISIVDTGAYFTATDVEAALQELAASSGALTYFTEARSTATPNATVPAHSFTATGAETNIDTIIAPKGSGAITANIPDNTTTGGNKRGIRAIDLQRSRTTAAQVASGASSAIVSGYNNTASGEVSAVIGGSTNTASNFGSIALGGNNNTSSGYASVAMGSSVTASGTYSFVAGQANSVSGSGSSAIGGRYGSDNGVGGTWIFGGNATYGTARSQQLTQVTQASTSNATPKDLTADGAAASSTNILVPLDGKVISFSTLISARDAISGDTKGWQITGMMKRGTGAGSVAIVGTPTSTVLGNDAGAAAWTIAVTADTTNGGLKFTATGAASTNVMWSAVTTCSYAG